LRVKKEGRKLNKKGIIRLSHLETATTGLTNSRKINIIRNEYILYDLGNKNYT
jgi:hypothetical protein